MLDGFAVDSLGWGRGKRFVMGNFMVFGDCEMVGATDGLTGQFSSTLALRGAGGIVWGPEESLDSEVAVRGVEKEQAGRKNVCEWVVAFRYK
jgi:hypothetical protein